MMVKGIILKPEEQLIIDCFLSHTPVTVLDYHACPGDKGFAIMKGITTIAIDTGRCYQILANDPLGEVLAIVLEQKDPVQFDDGYQPLGAGEDPPTIVRCNFLEA